MSTPTHLDLFAGAGGWSLAAREVGLPRVVGMEMWGAACATRAAAGLTTIRADVTTYPVETLSCRPGARWTLTASPPCQRWSTAGNGAARSRLGAVLEAVADLRNGWPGGWSCAAYGAGYDLPPLDVLVLEPLRWAWALRPEWIAMEQVKPVLPVWQAMRPVLDAWGYSTAASVLSSEQYGVPQTRERAILVAHRLRPARLPHPTHARYPRSKRARTVAEEQAALFEETPYVPMAAALGWGMSERPAFTLAPGCAAGGPDLVGGSGARAGMRREVEEGRFVVQTNHKPHGPDGGYQTRGVEHPAPTVTTQSHLWKLVNGKRSGATARALDAPAPTIFRADGTAAGDCRWVLDRPAFTVTGGEGIRGPKVVPDWTRDRPATTVVGSFSPSMIAAPGHRGLDTSRQDMPDSPRTTCAERGVLQSFPWDYPWQGNEGEKSQQIGNAIPPLLARAILAELVGDSPPVTTSSPPRQ